jgi:hypothetical protein
MISPLDRNGLQFTLLRAESRALQGRVTAFEQMKELTSPKREFPFLREPPGQTLQHAIHDLHKCAPIIQMFKSPSYHPSRKMSRMRQQDISAVTRRR